MKNLKEKVKEAVKNAKTRRKEGVNVQFKKKLPVLYIKLVIFGMALTGMQATFLPQAVMCTTLFGEYACDPWGNFVVAIVSMPGYLFTGKIMSFWPQAPSYVFFALLFGLSIILYFLLGFLMDKRSKGKVTLKRFIIFIVFTSLLILLAMLLALI